MPADDQIRRTWDALAPAYDTLSGFHDHEAWAAQLDALARGAGLSGRRLLDVGCGTGSSSAAMLARGYDVVGIDVSPLMLEQAGRKLGPEVPLHCHDMRSLPRLGEFDAVWCISDGINFLLDDAELAAAFTGFVRNLAPGGLAVFDVDTLASFRALYSSLLVVPAVDRVVIFEGRGGPDLPAGAIAEAHVDRLEPALQPPWWTRVRAVHRQRHHPQARIAHALSAAGLTLLQVWGTDGAGRSDRPLDERRHNKAVYIAQAAAPN